MEKVMAQIKNEYPKDVNVEFLNILKPENQMLMKYFGIASIPTQILLDKEGKEFFRHSDFIDKKELTDHFIFSPKN